MTKHSGGFLYLGPEDPRLFHMPNDTERILMLFTARLLGNLEPGGVGTEKNSLEKSGQVITISAEVTLNGGDCKGIPPKSP